MAIKASFTDVHGTTHANAVFEVQTVNLYVNENRTVQFDEGGQLVRVGDGTKTVDFRARFWASEVAKDDGMLPMEFQVMNENNVPESSFIVNGLEAPDAMTDEALYAAAEQALQNILTQGQEA